MIALDKGTFITHQHGSFVVPEYDIRKSLKENARAKARNPSKDGNSFLVLFLLRIRHVLNLSNPEPVDVALKVTRYQSLFLFGDAAVLLKCSNAVLL